MTKRPFGLALTELLGGPEDEPAAPAKAPGPERPAPAAAQAQEREPSQGERNLGIVPLTIHVSPADRRRLRMLSIETGISVQQLGISAWSMLLESRGLKPMEPTKASVPDGRRKRKAGE